MKIINKVANRIGFQVFLTGAGIFYLIFAFSYWDLSPMGWSVVARLFFGFILLIFGFLLAILCHYVKKEVKKDFRIIEIEKRQVEAKDSFLKWLISIGNEKGTEDDLKSRWEQRLKEVQEANKKAEGKTNG